MTAEFMEIDADKLNPEQLLAHTIAKKITKGIFETVFDKSNRRDLKKDIESIIVFLSSIVTSVVVNFPELDTLSPADNTQIKIMIMVGIEECLEACIAQKKKEILH